MKRDLTVGELREALAEFPDYYAVAPQPPAPRRPAMADQKTDKDQKRGHVLVIEPDAAYAARFPDAPVEYRWSIECLNVAECGGWQECPESHEVIGEPVNDGPWESDETAPWFEEEEFEFHGVGHEWRYGYGWTVPFDGCVVAENAGYIDCPVEPMRPGRWLVDDEWDDTYLTLDVIEDLAFPPGKTTSDE